MRARIAVAVGLLVGGLGAGCFDPHAPVGAPCSPTQACPAPLACAGAVCVEPGAALADAHVTRDVAPPGDAPLDDALPPDGPHPDAPPVPWLLVQTADIEDATTLPLAATKPGSLLVVGLETDLASPTKVADDSGDVFAQIPNSIAADHTQKTGLEIWIAPAIAGGAHSITVTPLNAHVIYSIAVWEVANLSPVAPVDTVATLDDQAASTAPAGATVQTTSPGDFVVGIAIVQNVVSGLTSGSVFTNDLMTHGNGWAHLTSASAPPGLYHPRWTQPTSGTSCATSIALFAAQP